MLYADVIVKQRTNVEVLTYSVPAGIVPYIRLGSAVTVPVRRRSILAVVVALKQKVASELKNVIRPITAIEREAAYSSNQIATIRELARQSGSSLAEVAFHALGLTARDHEKIEKIQPGQPLFLQASPAQRHKFYRELIGKYGQQRSFVLIFPALALAKNFADSLPGEVSAILDDGKAASRQKLAEHLRTGQPFVVIGTLNRVFTPLHPRDFLVIDQPYHLGNKQQQRPYLRSKTIAVVRGQTEGLAVIFGALLPSVTDVLRFSRREWRLKSIPGETKPLQVLSRRGTRELLLPGLVGQLRRSLDRGQKILFLVLSRGWAPALVCAECGHVATCAVCGRTTAVEGERLVCRYCHHQENWPRACPICQASDWRSVGEGVARAAQELTQKFPDATHQSISGEKVKFDSQAQLTIATEKIFSFPQARFDVVVFLSIDRLLSGSDLDQAWTLLNFLLYFQAQKADIIISTYFPDHELWGIAGQGQIKQFFAHELSRRQKYRLPPYAYQFRVVGQARTEHQLEEQAEQVYQDLIKRPPHSEIGALETERLPSGEWRGSLTVLVAQTLSPAAKDQLRDVLPPAWHLDVEL